MAPFTLASLAGLGAVVALAALLRGRLYATFAAVLLGIHTLISTTLAPHAGPLLPLAAGLQAVVFVHFAMLVRPRMRPLVYRLLVSLPASWFFAGTFLAFPWAIAVSFGLPPAALWLPYAVAALGLVESLVLRPEEVEFSLGAAAPQALARHPLAPGASPRPLRIVQISDPHLGPFMSERRLRAVCERAVAQQPDLVLLTGDFLTMESHHDPLLLGRALEPLRALAGKTFACRGNHDHEAPEHVARSLDHAGVLLLNDEQTLVETPAGAVEILGIDFRSRGRQEHLAAVASAHPRSPGLLRVAMLHDPGAFKHLPPGTADLVLSGHTHGGQLGLLRLGLPHTVVSALSDIPDHGLWARGTERLYVHRGTCHYGFPLRIGVPAEESLLLVHPPLP